MKNLQIPYDAPLNDLDTETETFGCRQNNPEICGNHSLNGICAFTSNDYLCKKPSRSWKKQYTILKNK